MERGNWKKWLNCVAEKYYVWVYSLAKVHFLHWVKNVWAKTHESRRSKKRAFAMWLNEFTLKTGFWTVSLNKYELDSFYSIIFHLNVYWVKIIQISMCIWNCCLFRFAAIPLSSFPTFVFFFSCFTFAVAHVFIFIIRYLYYML